MVQPNIEYQRRVIFYQIETKPSRIDSPFCGRSELIELLKTTGQILTLVNFVANEGGALRVQVYPEHKAPCQPTLQRQSGTKGTDEDGVAPINIGLFG